jgi:hypothetical protein
MIVLQSASRRLRRWLRRRGRHRLRLSTDQLFSLVQRHLPHMLFL